MCMPREPLVFGQPRRPISSRNAFTSKSDGANIGPIDARTGIEIDAQLVGMFEIAGPYGVRMQLDTAQVDDPGEARGIVDDQFFGGTAGGKRERYGPQPGGPLSGRALLIKSLALGAIHEALEHDRAILNSGQSSRRDRQIITSRDRASRF